MKVMNCQNCASQTAGYKDCEDMNVKTKERKENEDRLCCSEPLFEIIVFIIFSLLYIDSVILT